MKDETAGVSNDDNNNNKDGRHDDANDESDDAAMLQKGRTTSAAVINQYKQQAWVGQKTLQRDILRVFSMSDL